MDRSWSSLRFFVRGCFDFRVSGATSNSMFPAVFLGLDFEMARQLTLAGVWVVRHVVTASGLSFPVRDQDYVDGVML